MGRKLDIRSPRLHPDLPDHRKRRIPHDLILPIRQGLNRCHRDRIPRMHPHRIQILNRTDHHTIVRTVPHHLHLEFLPTQQALINQHFAHRRQIQPPRHNRLKFLTVVRNPTTSPTQRKPGPDDQRKRPDVISHAPRLLHRVRNPALRHVEADLDHRLLELHPVLTLLNRVRLRPDHPHAMLRQHTRVPQRHRRVQRRLPAQRRQQRIRLLPLDDLLHHVRRDRLNISPVRKLRIRHDRRRIRIDQHHRVPFLLQRLARLNAGIIKLAALPDHNRTRTNDEYLVNRSVFGH